MLAGMEKSNIFVGMNVRTTFNTSKSQLETARSKCIAKFGYYDYPLMVMYTIGMIEGKGFENVNYTSKRNAHEDRYNYNISLNECMYSWMVFCFKRITGSERYMKTQVFNFFINVFINN